MYIYSFVTMTMMGTAVSFTASSSVSVAVLLRMSSPLTGRRQFNLLRSLLLPELTRDAEFRKWQRRGGDRRCPVHWFTKRTDRVQSTGGLIQRGPSEGVFASRGRCCVLPLWQTVEHSKDVWCWQSHVMNSHVAVSMIILEVGESLP